MCRGYLQPLYLHVSDLEIVLRFSKDDTELSSAAFVAALLADETGGGPPQSGGGAKAPGDAAFAKLGGPLTPHVGS
jgi:hypothetical protein